MPPPAEAEEKDADVRFVRLDLGWKDIPKEQPDLKASCELVVPAGAATSVWAGVASARQDPPLASGTSGVYTAFMLAPGLDWNYLLGQNGWFLGVDVHILLILNSEGNSGLPLFAQFGKRF